MISFEFECISHTRAWWPYCLPDGHITCLVAGKKQSVDSFTPTLIPTLALTLLEGAVNEIERDGTAMCLAEVMRVGAVPYTVCSYGISDVISMQFMAIVINAMCVLA